MTFFVILAVIAGAILGLISGNIFSKIWLRYAFIQMERNFLSGAMSLIQFKYHAIAILEIAYSEQIEKDPSRKEELDQIVEKIHEKFDGYADSWVKQTISLLPYKPEYNDWAGALLFVERLIKGNGNKP
jgi:hypothetical protein